MAYDRYDPRNEARGERPRWSDDRFEGRDRYERGDRGSGREERGFLERAGDEIASWFGGDDDHRRGDEHMGRERERERGMWRSPASERDRDYRPAFGREDRAPGRDWGRERDRDYRPMTGDYGRREQADYEQFAASGPSRRGYGYDENRRTSYAGSSERGASMDPHYHSWRERQISDLDRDYDEYRREHQSKFESDFAGWRERRMQKRGLLGEIREHMEVVGKDDEHLGTVDKVAGDRIILAKSDPDSGGAHHSLSCSDIDRVDGERVILDCSADEARHRWRDENRSRALFEREDQGEIGPRVLDRSFEGTYRR